MPFIDYGAAATHLEQAIYEFEQAHPEFKLTSYDEILESNSLKWDIRLMTDVDVSRLEGQVVTALLMGAVRAENYFGSWRLDISARWVSQRNVVAVEERPTDKRAWREDKPA